ERVLYFSAYIVLDPGRSEVTGLRKQQILSEQQYRELKEQFGSEFRAGMGAEAIRELLAEIDLDKMCADLRAELKDEKGQKKEKTLKRLKVAEEFRLSGNRPEWMVLEVVPVIPPDLRPMVALDGGRFATSDLNDLYRRVINRNNRLKKLLELGAPDIIIRNEKRMLQEAVDSLLDNGRHGNPVKGPGGRNLKSLSDMLKGKQGRFRQNLLGKRVDYSGRSVIVVGPELKFYQCGVPKTMALELFKPFIACELIAQGYAANVKKARKMVENAEPEVWEVLDGVIKEHPVMLNRAPTLHRLGIQAFEPVLVEGKALKLHPLACPAFNADFDGDQMAIHVPLSEEAQAEARFLMLSVNNILAPKDGSPITIPTQDMILGAYYLTYPGDYYREETDEDGTVRRVYAKKDELNDRKFMSSLKENGYKRVPEKGDGSVFADYDEMLMAYQSHVVSTHALVRVRVYAGPDDKRGKLVQSTVGRFLYNEKIPQDLGFVDRSVDPYSLEVDFLIDKKGLGKIIDHCFRVHENTETVQLLDYVKSMGYKYSTLSAVTIGVEDMVIPKEKDRLVNAAQAEVDKYENMYRRGLLSNQERWEKQEVIWRRATKDVGSALMKSLSPSNNIYIMATSGARGSEAQISQIGGMRGLMGTATGKTVEIPIKANFREGLSILDYFISANGARKGLADTALRTANSGYMTRRLVDVSHSMIVTEEDCGTDEGFEVSEINESSGGASKETDETKVLESLRERIAGRTAAEDIINPETGEIITKKNEEITEAAAEFIDTKTPITTVRIRNVMTCKCKNGVCCKCYGRNLATGQPVHIGEAVGVMAAQSIGEPGTQLTMRTFHTGGVAGSDITQGLPRVEELFEAREPKGVAEICKASGTVRSIHTTEDEQVEIVVDRDDTSEKAQDRYVIPYGARPAVLVGGHVNVAENISEGPLSPQSIFALKGAKGVYDYLIRECQKVYKGQGVDINDKHIEIIINQMLSKYEVEDPGTTSLFPGEKYSLDQIREANEKAEAEGGEPAEYHHLLLGITKAALAADSFLSAASFQETTKVLTDAAVKGKTDHLKGMKENVIVGKLIPAGTGMKRYRNIKVDYGENEEYVEEGMRKAREERRKRREPIQEQTKNIFEHAEEKDFKGASGMSIVDGDAPVSE
ncbi:MAG: DNA-directed RNA polymerase subunit beta', partial [Eubacteriales bacterium]|nr:DNA-directed RNA polymerase subunit beta' [Eubacteriales bacterium]